MYLYIEPLACLLSLLFLVHTFRSFSLSFPCLYAAPCNSLLSFLIIRLFAFRQCLITLRLFVSHLSHPTPPPPPPRSIYFVSLSIYLSNLSCLYSLSRPMATLALIRTGDEPSTVGFCNGLYPARDSALARVSLSSNIRPYFYKNIVECLFANKNAMDFGAEREREGEKTYENEKQSSWHRYRIYSEYSVYSVTYFLKILFGALYSFIRSLRQKRGRGLIMQEWTNASKITAIRSGGFRVSLAVSLRHTEARALPLSHRRPRVPLSSSRSRVLHSLVRIIRAPVHGRELFTYTFKVNRTNCLCVICDMSSDRCLPLSVMSCLLVP